MHRESTSRSHRRAFVTTAGVGLLLAIALAPSPARAHFVLTTPASWMSQDSLGSPQKLGPCGDEGGGTASGMVTSFKPGETITITVDEKIFHPGHYRVALSVNDRSELPAEPPVTAGSTPCGTVPVENPAVFPVLADGVLDHTAAFSGPQTISVKLPDNVSCTKCTLQVIEFMSDHPLNNPGGCFYHHCADIAIEADAGSSMGDDAGSTANDAGGGAVDASAGGSGGSADSGGSGGSGGPRDDASAGDGNTAATANDGGCAVSTLGSASLGRTWEYLAAALVAVVWRRRKRAS